MIVLAHHFLNAERAGVDFNVSGIGCMCAGPDSNGHLPL